MKPDRAHRTLNTVLLIMIAGMVAVKQPPIVEPTAADYLMQAAFYFAVLALTFLLIKIGFDHRAEIVRYLGIRTGEP